MAECYDDIGFLSLEPTLAGGYARLCLGLDRRGLFWGASGDHAFGFADGQVFLLDSLGDWFLFVLG